MEIKAKVKGIKYKPYLCKKLTEYSFSQLSNALSSEGSFILRNTNQQAYAVSWWVSAKRTRSYPYSRIYNTLAFGGKKITIIPVYKDEGADGDRDYIQWDTISLMSLLGVYVILGYYTKAEKNYRYKNKITSQRFDSDFILKQISKLSSYQSDALHWNLLQLESIQKIAKQALDVYKKISINYKVKMHSEGSTLKRIKELTKSKDEFMKFSRDLARKAQEREVQTVQPKESVSGEKGLITINNYLGGLYYFTVDEVEITSNKINLIEAKHSKKNALPSLDDIKDGLIKMILFSNINEAHIGNKRYRTKAVLKLTSSSKFNYEDLDSNRKSLFDKLKKEASINNFKIRTT